MESARHCARENLGQLIFDPTLGYCAPLHVAAEKAGPRVPGWEAAVTGEVSRPVRAFFRRVATHIDERLTDERTVCPASQAWQALGLCALAGCAPGPVAGIALVLAGRCLRFVFEQLDAGAGAYAPRVYELTGSDDWLDPLPETDALLLEAACALEAAAVRLSLPAPEDADAWIERAYARLAGGFGALLMHPSPLAQARALTGLLAMQARPARYRSEAEPLVWALADRVAAQQDDEGSWEGLLRPTAEAAAALALYSAALPRLAVTDVLSRAVGWFARMHRAGRGLPLPMAGLRVVPYALQDLGALLEAGRRVTGVDLLHPHDRQRMYALHAAWVRFATGRHFRLPRNTRHAGQWVAGISYIRDQRRWKREPFVDPGAVGRVAQECLLADPDETMGSAAKVMY